MNKKPPARRRVKPFKNERSPETDVMVKNALAEAVLGFNPGSIGVQLSQTDTLFINNRWYLISNMRQILNQIYAEHGLIQTICAVPVEDAFRGGIEINSKILDEDDILQLQNVIEREGDLLVAAQTCIWNRLFGGAGTVVITGQDPASELDQTKLKEDSPLSFRACDMWELFWTYQNTSDYAAAIDDYDHLPETFDYYGVKLNKSRVLPMRGIEAPSFIRPRLRGWGLSVIESVVRSINQYLKATDLVFEVLDEFKIDVYKIKNLAATLLQAGGTEKVQKRVQIMNLQKNYQNAVTMDSEDDYVSKELSFAGIGETMEGIRLQVASDLRMPLSKVFGISATGFNSGEDDIENYNAMIESTIRGKAKVHVLKMVELRCQQQFGYIPDDLSINFKPLRILSSEQQENVKNAIFTRAIQARQAGEIDSKQFKEVCNKSQLLPIQLDTSVDTLDMGQDNEEESGNESKAPKAPASKLKTKEAKT